MKLFVFDAADGDCLLFESSDGRLLLVDGGRSGSFKDNTAQFLEELAAESRALDVVCVSHIDADHITGILTLLDLLLERRIHEFQLSRNNDDHRVPTFTMPVVDQIWHNGFETLLGIGRASPIASELATVSRISSAGNNLEVLASAQQWAQSERQSATLSLQALDVLRIPINGALHDPAPLVVGGTEPDPKLGSTTVKLLAPHQEDLDELQEEFDKWLAANRSLLDDLILQAERDANKFANEIERLVEPIGQLATALNNRGNVTPENLASIMLHLDDGGHTMLLTGDGHGNDIIKGLEHHGLLDPDAGIHVDLLKIPHHGSEFNIEYEKAGSFIRSDFLRRVTANHYVFCGDGSHENPDQDIVKAVIDARVGSASVRSPNPEADREFKLWFTGNPPRISDENDRLHMQGIRNYVRRRARRNSNILKFEFLDHTHFEIDPALPI
jgi:beta-lactamase superfamily II metal-dependent hydrolase